jgi:N-dimethylarginine dimethylaminohydrolase
MSTAKPMAQYSGAVPCLQPTFLMCPPTLYDVSYVINPWMAGNIHRCCQRQAMQQWERLYVVLSRLAQVELVEPQRGSPDMVFTANAGLVRQGVVALSRFLHPERQGEEPHFRRWFDDSGYSVLEFPPATSFEGEGDALFEWDGSRLWAGFGIRTRETSHHYLRQTWGSELLSLRLVDSRFYHLDTCFAPLFGGYVMYFPAAFDSGSRAKIEASYLKEKRIPIPEPDALRFACNAVNIGKVVIVNEISDDLSYRLQSHGFVVLQVELSEFLKAGGAAKCLVLRLSELEVTHSVMASPSQLDC